MLIATFGPSTGWSGKTITYEEGVFTLEGHGAVRASDVLNYSQQGHLTWASDGVRDWVQQLAGGSPTAPPVAQPAATTAPLVAPLNAGPLSAPSASAQAPRSSDAPLKRKLAGLPVWAWTAIGALVVVAVVVGVLAFGRLGGGNSWAKTLEGTWTDGKSTVVITNGPGKTASLKMDFVGNDTSPTSLLFDADTLVINQGGEPEHYTRTSGGSSDFTGDYSSTSSGDSAYDITFEDKTLAISGASEPFTFTLTDDGNLFSNRLGQGGGGVTLSRK